MTGRTVATRPGDDRIRAALRAVVDPCSVAAGHPLDVVEMGLVRGWSWQGGLLRVDLCVTGPGCGFVGVIAAAIRTAVAPLGVTADCVLDPTVVWDESMMTGPARASLARRRASVVTDLGLRPQMWREADAAAVS